MVALSGSIALRGARVGANRARFSRTFQYGRSPAYRRLQQSYSTDRTNHTSNPAQSTIHLSPLVIFGSKLHYRSLLDSSLQLSPTTRHLHSCLPLLQHAKPQEDIRDQPRQEPASESQGAGFSFRPSVEEEAPSSSPGKTASKEEPLNEDSQARERKAQDQTQQPNGEESQQKSDEGSENQEESKKSKDGEEGEEGEKKDKKPPPPPPHGDKSPWQVFTETLKSEFQASKEWNESTKALASSAHDFTQNPALKRAQEAYRIGSDAATSTTAKALKKTGSVIGHGAAAIWDTTPVKGIRAGVNATGRGLEKVTRPVRETEAYKSVREVIDDGSSSRYGGWVEKEQRKINRETREMKEAARSGRPLRNRTEKIEEDPEAGTNVTLHKDAAWKESWRDFRDNSKLMQNIFSMRSAYNESENPLISTARSISDRVAGFFAENEMALVIRKFREMDPNFQLEPFLQDMREYILPEVLDAYVKGDAETLKLWLSAAQFQVYSALMQQYTTNGLKSDGRILDIRNVDVLNARMLEPGEIPVFILTARTQEVHVYRNAKTGELAAGMEDRVQQVTYAIGVTRIPEDVNNTETRGWRLIELQKSSRSYY